MPSAIFLDRDGTICVEKNYITMPDQLELLPNAAAGIIALRALGCPILVVTNQAAVAHGLIDEQELATINFRLLAMLGAEGAQVDGFYSCPHHPEGKVPELAIECDCRKPRAGLLEQASREHGFTLYESVMIGDSLRDMQAGKTVGAKTILVRTGFGLKTLDGKPSIPEAWRVADDLLDASRMLK